MNEAFSEADSRPSGSTRTDSTGKTSGAVILGGEEEVLILEGSWEWSETVRRAWQKWSFLRISRGSLVSLTSLSLPPTAWIMLGWGQAWVGLRWLEETESIRGSTARVESLSKSAGGGGVNFKKFPWPNGCVYDRSMEELAGSDGVMGLRGIWIFIRRFISPSDNDLVFYRADSDDRCEKLFDSIVSNPDHKLHHFLPPKNYCHYNLRRQRHFANPVMRTKRFSSTFLPSMCRR